MTTRRRASHHYELSDRRTGMTWTRRREAIRAARMSGASAVYVVRYPRVGRIATGTARTIVWSNMKMSAQLIAAKDALHAHGYDTYETACGSLYIVNVAPSALRYQSTEAGSEWDEECQSRLGGIQSIITPCGCEARWSDNDVCVVEV